MELTTSTLEVCQCARDECVWSWMGMWYSKGDGWGRKGRMPLNNFFCPTSVTWIADTAGTALLDICPCHTPLCSMMTHAFLMITFLISKRYCCVPEDVSGKHPAMEIVRNSKTHDVFNGARSRICETVQPLSVLWPKDLTTPDLLSPSHLTLPRRSVGIIVLRCYTHVYIILYNMLLILQWFTYIY